MLKLFKDATILVTKTINNTKSTCFEWEWKNKQTNKQWIDRILNWNEEKKQNSKQHIE